MTIPKNLDGCRAKLTALRATLAEQIAAGEGIYSTLPAGLQTTWNKAQAVGAALLSGMPTVALFSLYEQGIENVTSQLVGDWDTDVKVLASVSALHSVETALAAKIDAYLQSDQIETRESELEDERPDFDESSDFDFLTEVPRGYAAAVN